MRACQTSTEQNPKTIFYFFAVLHFAIAILTVACGGKSKTWSTRYDTVCGLSAANPTGEGDVVIDLGSEVRGRFFLYYELDGFQHNHFRQRRSYSGDQLLGKPVIAPSECDPLARINGIAVFPCGLLPLNFFNDSFDVTTDNAVFSEEGIAWQNEIGNLYKEPSEEYPPEVFRPLKSLVGETINEHFVVWMRLAKAGRFRKLWARAVSETLGPKLTVHIECGYPWNTFSGPRSLVLVKAGGMGGKNTFLTVMNFLIAAICLAFGLIFQFPCVTRSKGQTRLDEEEPTASQLNAGEVLG